MPDSEILKKVLDIGKLVLAESDLDKVLEVAMDEAIAATGAERGIIILFDEAGEKLFQTARKLKKQDIEHPEFEISKTIIKKTKDTGEPVFFRNALESALEDTSIRSGDSIITLKLLSVLCLPLTYQTSVFGVVYLDNPSLDGAFTETEFAFAQNFADFIAVAARNALERRQLVERLEKEQYQFEGIIGSHPSIMKVLKLIRQIADSQASILITGGSGTGKELVARAIHKNSSRKNQEFVAINCGALPENLLEDELFGHKAGAFTGASRDRKGWFEKANRGTIFLDEVSEMSKALQVKLLRVLQEHKFSRLGDPEVRNLDVRVVAATNLPLKELIQAGKFRADLFWRLKVVDIELPSLSERKSDIPLLIHHFLKKYGSLERKDGVGISAAAQDCLMKYDYPGNVRELENFIHGAVVLCKDRVIQPHHLPSEVLQENFISTQSGHMMPFRAVKEQVVSGFERDYISRILTQTNGNVTRAAQIAELDVKNLRDKISRYGIDPRSFK
ncbi:MAG: sigma-54 interaction domain-containing protein [bacterium]